MYFLYFFNYLPLERGGALHLMNPHHPRIGPVVLEKKMKLWKVYVNDANNDDDDSNNDGQQTIFYQ